MKIVKHFFLLLPLSCLTLFATTQPAKHVILISIDGFRPDFYLDKTWPAPNLQRLMQTGVYAREARSVFPSVTYPSHTSIVTGAYPGKHGVYYNAPRGAKKGQWYWEESYIKVPTLWDAVKAAGLKSGAVMWPVTVGAPITYNFPVRRADNDESSNQLEITRPFVTPANLLTEMEKVGAPFTVADFDANHTIDFTIARMGSYIFKTYEPALLALHFVTLDHAEHENGREGEIIRSTIASIDSMVGVVWQTVKTSGLEKQTAIIVTGDHGFVDNTNTFSPNVLLAQAGLITTDESLASFQGVGGSAFLYLKNKGDEATLQKVKDLLDALPADQKVFRIVDRKEMDSVGANPEPALALAMNKGYIALGDSKGKLMGVRRKGGNHGYYPDFHEISTGFIAAGAGIGPHAEIKMMGIKDVAPLVARLLNLSFKAPDGVLVPGILKP